MKSYVPCYNYYKKAFKMAADEGMRVGFWEAGNGLENYYKFMWKKWYISKLKSFVKMFISLAFPP